MIYVVATITVNPGCREKVAAAISDNLAAVRAENGCIGYSPAVDIETGLAAQIPLRDTVITIVEAWTSLDALNEHLAAPHMAVYREKVKDWVAGVDLQVLKSLD